MTDLEILNSIKEKDYFTNSFLLERDIFDDNQACSFDNQSTDEFFYFFKKTKYDFKNMFFYANKTAVLANKSIFLKEPYFVTELITLDNKKEQTFYINNWLYSQENFHYRTNLRMYRYNNLPVDELDFSLVQNPDQNDLEEIIFHLELNFDKYSEKIPSIEELKKWQNSTYIIKEDNQIAAILISEMKGTTNELHFWLVISKFRGKGYGDLVFKYCLNCNKEIQRYTSWININHQYSIKKHIECGFLKDRITNKIYLNINIMKEEIIKILEETRPEFDFSEENIDFISAGYLDSFDIITLVVDLETKFDVKIIGALILPENFSSVAAILKLIETSKNAS